MGYIEINKLLKNPKKVNKHIEDLNNYMKNRTNQVFILFYMEGCGPCNATRPEWHKMRNVLSDDFLNRKDIQIVSIDKDYADKLECVKSQPVGFPTMRYMIDGGEISENYEDSSISTKDRTIDSFIEWIKNKTGEQKITRSEVPQEKGHKIKNMRLRLNRKKTIKKPQRGGKWSLKYKRSINCKRPKGFSQKQYCKYSRKR
jgi:hypothetical protein